MYPWIVGAVTVAHLGLLAVWLGSMAYSLFVVQPVIATRYPDEVAREELLLRLADGNRWRVVALLVVLLASGAALTATSDGLRAGGYAAATVLVGIAGAIFVNVSWRHWPARVFALPGELAGYRRRLRFQAVTMLGLVGTAYLAALLASIRI